MIGSQHWQYIILSNVLIINEKKLFGDNIERIPLRVMDKVEV